MTSYPEDSFPLVVFVCGTDKQSFGTRLEAMVALVKACYYLSGIYHFAKNKSSLQNHILQDNGNFVPNDGVVYEASESNEGEKGVDTDDQVVAASKTKIKRQAKLNQLKKKTIVFRNEFSSKCPELCFYPLFKAFLPSFTQWVNFIDPQSKAQSQDEITSILPSQALLSLGAFLRCSMNSSHFRYWLASTVHL